MPDKHMVVGSNPTGGTTLKPCLKLNPPNCSEFGGFFLVYQQLTDSHYTSRLDCVSLETTPLVTTCPHCAPKNIPTNNQLGGTEKTWGHACKSSRELPCQPSGKLKNAAKPIEFATAIPHTHCPAQNLASPPPCDFVQKTKPKYN